MKKVLKRILVLIVALALLSSCFVACNNNNNDGSKPSENPSTPNEKPTDKVVYTLHLSADKTNVGRGDKVILSAVLKAEGQEDIPSEDTEFIIVSGADYAGIIGNTLTVRSTAPDGAKIEVQAKEGASTSNTITITVSVPLNSITISAETTKPVAGQSVTITKVLDPSDATQPISWTITEGSDIATMNGDKLVVSENASVGDVIKLKATFEDVESNELVLTVKSATDEIKATKVTISAEKYNLFENTSVILSAVTEPAVITDDVVFYIVEGEDYAEIIGNVLKIKAGTPVGTTIKVEASAGTTVSVNELTFKVIQEPKPAQSITIDALNLTPLAGQTVTIDYRINPSDTTDVMSWVIIEGGDYAEMSGNILVVKDTAPDNAVIKVKATVGNVESDVLTFTVKPKQVEDVEIKAENIIISANKNTVVRGDEIVIDVNVLPENHTDEVRLIITQGADHATLVGKTLVISDDAPDGTVIKVKAIGDEAGSNELAFTVKVEVVTKPAQSVTISTDNLNPIAGSRVEINCVVDPADTTDTVRFVILEGGEIAQMVGNVLVISDTAEKDAVIKVQAIAGDVESEVLEFTVKPLHEEILIESIEISAEGGVEQVLAGNTVNINVEKTPVDATQQISWVLLEGSARYARMDGNKLVINSGVRAGTVIKIKARATNGDTRIDSNVLTFTVAPSEEEILANTFYIDLSETVITLDKKGTGAIPTLIAEVYNGLYDKVEGKEIIFTIIDGAQYLDIDSIGSNCTFLSLKGHGTVVVEARIKGTDVVETATVKVIVPPDSITIPEVFSERNDIEYSFSLLDHEISGASSNVVKEAGASKLPFAFSAVGSELSCKDVAISFTHESGKVGDEVAVYENGAITFKMTGKVVVTVSSVSGSENEASVSYTFNINDGYNVNTFEELWLVVQNKVYQGQQINFVVLEKPVGQKCTVKDCYCGGKHYNYGYDIVPLVALKDHKDQTVHNILKGPDEVPAMHSNRIQAVNKSLYINGNDHKIDVSQMRIFTEAEYDDYCNDTGTTNQLPYVAGLLTAEPWNDGGDVGAGTNNNKTYYVNLYNLETKGNVSVDYDVTKFRSSGSDDTVIGGYTHGINIGTREYQCHYYIDADGLTSSGFYSGVSFLGIVGNGTVSNVHAYNCYSTGIFCRSSIMTLENLKFGRCGATGIELAPEECDQAGLNDNENQHVTIKGTIDAYANVNDGNTNYFKDYSIQGATIPQIIEGNAAAIVQTWEQLTGKTEYGEIAVSHIKNQKGEFIFVGLLFNNMSTLAPNTSILTYDEGGIISVYDLPKDGSIDHEHQFISMPVMVTLPGLGTIQAGTAIFYNHNYYSV